ncbi:MAG: outer membrane protein transport protein [Gemmatimonadota bacterium]|jgi:long-subunit fatty acid transport protein
MLRFTLRGLLPAAIVAVTIPGSGTAQTNGFVLQCFSARTAGQGCVTRAQTATPTNLFRDPAGLVAFESPAFEVNVAPFMPTLTFENSANSGTTGARHAYPLASAAYVGPKLGGRLAWAVGMEPIGGFGSDFLLTHELLSGPAATPVEYESFFAAVKLGPAVALEIAEGFSVGASASLLYEEIRDFRMPFTMPPSAAAGMEGIPMLDAPVYGPLFEQFTEMTAYGDSRGYAGVGWAADLGVRYEHPSGLILAASWSPERRVEVDGATAVIDMTMQFGQMMEAMVMARAQAYGEQPAVAQQAVMGQLEAAGLDLARGVVAEYEAATEITLPVTAGLGVSLPAGEHLRLAAETEWRRWSSAERTMPFRLTGGDNANINLMMNGDPSDGSFTYPFPLDWKDSWSAKVGATWTLASGNALRAGYLYGENPVPDNTVFITFPAISTRALTFGTTWAVAGVPLDLSVVRAFEADIEGCSHGHKLGAEYLESRTTMTQTVVTLGTRLAF